MTFDRLQEPIGPQPPAMGRERKGVGQGVRERVERKKKSYHV